MLEVFSLIVELRCFDKITMNKAFQDLTPEEFFPLLLALGREKEARKYLTQEEHGLHATIKFFYDATGDLWEERFRHPSTNEQRKDGYKLLRNKYMRSLLDLGVPFEIDPEKESLLGKLPDYALRLLTKSSRDYFHSWLWLEVDEVLRHTYNSMADLGFIWHADSSIWAYQKPNAHEQNFREKARCKGKEKEIRLKYSELVELPGKIVALADLVQKYCSAVSMGGWMLPEGELPLIRMMNKLHRLSTVHVFENFDEMEYFKPFFKKGAK